MVAAMKIIGSYVSPYVRKVLVCMELKGIDYEVDPITPFFGNDEFRRLSPLCRIPVLIDEGLVLTDEIRSIVNSAIDALPEDLRTAIVLRELEGLSYEEIAERLNCSTGTVASRLNRSRALLARKLGHLRGQI